MDQLQRFIDLVNKTGDKLVIFDRYQPDNSFVILGINDYEQLVTKPSALGDLTEEELADKINGDIAIWKNEQLLSDFRDNDCEWEDDAWADLSGDCLASDEEDYQFGADETDDNTSQSEDELSYLYPEPPVLSPLESAAVPEPIISNDAEIVADETVDFPEPLATSEVSVEESEDLALPTEPANSKPDFQSLGDILESKYERSNNWTIPSDRKRLAADELSNRYETIGF